MRSNTSWRVLLTLAVALCLAYAPSSRAIIVTMDANGVPFDGELRVGTGNIGMLFFHGRGGNYAGNYVRQVGTTMNTLGYTTFSLANPEPTTGNTSWPEYVNQEDYIDDQLFARLDAALTEMAALGIEHVVLNGLSMGSRLMTAAAAAWETGIFNPTANISLQGLIGAGMYSYTDVNPTLPNPTTIDDFNVYDVHSNLAFIQSIPVLDLFGDQDSLSAIYADTRHNAYGGADNQYVQTPINCPPRNGTYYAYLGGTSYVPYYGANNASEDRCHQLRDGYLRDENGNYYLAMRVRGTLDAPVEMAINSFMDQYVIPRTQVHVPEPGALALMLLGLPMLYLSRRRRISM